jgi:hypothetical protein
MTIWIAILVIIHGISTEFLDKKGDYHGDDHPASGQL